MLLATSWWIIMTTIMAGRIYVLTGSKQVWLLLIPLGCWLVCRGLTWHASQRGDVMGVFITFPLEVLAWPERRGNTLMEEVGDYRHTELGDAIYQAKQSVCVCVCATCTTSRHFTGILKQLRALQPSNSPAARNVYFCLVMPLQGARCDLNLAVSFPWAWLMSWRAQINSRITTLTWV